MLKRMISKKIQQFFFLIGCLCLLTGCKDTPWKTDNYFLCGTESEFEAGIEIFNPQGESVLQMPRTIIQEAILSDGTLLNRSAGVLPSDSFLFITTGSDIEHVKTGIWGVEEEKWMLQPAEGYAYILIKDGKMISFDLDHVSYGIDFQPIHGKRQDIYELSDGTKLKNIMNHEGNFYIGAVDETCYLDGNTFYEKNCHLGIPLTKENSICIDKCVAGKYIVVRYNYTEVRSDTDILMTEKSYLCDLNGVIQYSEWNYDGVDYVSNELGQKDTRYLMFINDEEMPFHYLDVEQNQEILFPTGYGKPFYIGNGIFRLENHEAQTYTLYNAVEQKIGNTFAEDRVAKNDIFGFDTYFDYQNKKLVINGKQQKYPLKNIYEMYHLFSDNYSIVQYNTTDGEIVSCVFDTKGNFVCEVKEDIRYVDESCYIVLEGNKYKILKSDFFERKY